ncbi:unnamed protein product, partial [Didymodactylos carnosus]
MKRKRFRGAFPNQVWYGNPYLRVFLLEDDFILKR